MNNTRDTPTVYVVLFDDYEEGTSTVIAVLTSQDIAEEYRALCYIESAGQDLTDEIEVGAIQESEGYDPLPAKSFYQHLDRVIRDEYWGYSIDDATLYL